MFDVGAEEVLETNQQNRSRLQREALYDDALEQYQDFQEKSKVFIICSRLHARH